MKKLEQFISDRFTEITLAMSVAWLALVAIGLVLS